jgi:hypothetical protein
MCKACGFRCCRSDVLYGCKCAGCDCVWCTDWDESDKEDLFIIEEQRRAGDWDEEEGEIYG